MCTASPKKCLTKGKYGCKVVPIPDVEKVATKPNEIEEFQENILFLEVPVEVTKKSLYTFFHKFPTDSDRKLWWLSKHQETNY